MLLIHSYGKATVHASLSTKCHRGIIKNVILTKTIAFIFVIWMQSLKLKSWVHVKNCVNPHYSKAKINDFFKNIIWLKSTKT